MLLRTLWNLSLLAPACLAAPTEWRKVLHEKRELSSDHLRRASRVDSDAIIPIRIALTQSNLENGYAHVMDVSHPSSENYGKHWSQEKVHKTFAPSEETIEAVRAWLASSKVDSRRISQTENKGWFEFSLPVEDAEHLFSTKYYEHEDLADGTVKIGCDQYSLPEHIAPHVDYVTPGVALSPPLLKRTFKRDSVGDYVHKPFASPDDASDEPSGHKSYGEESRPSGQAPGHKSFAEESRYSNTSIPASLKNCGKLITPACIRFLYRIPKAHLNDSLNALGIFEFEDFYAQGSLNSFFKKYASNVPNGTHPQLASIGKGPLAKAPAPVGQDGGESDIDLDMSYSLIYPQKITLYQTAPTPYTQKYIEHAGSLKKEGLLFGQATNNLLDALDGSFCTSTDKKEGLQCGTFKPTRVISASYGAPEIDPGLPVAVQKRQCNEIMKLTLQGHTVVFSSGDYGVASHAFKETSNGCLAAGSLTQGPTGGKIFSPQFPANCPYVLSVGATQLTKNQTVLDPEGAMNVPGASAKEGIPLTTFSSSGGFANYFPMPGYQKTAVDTYFAQHDPGYPSYNYNGIDSLHNGSNIGANGGVYNKAGRGTPDVSANGAYFATFISGEAQPEFGTSLAAPLWASVITLINEERTAKGKGPVGFINPVLYEHPEAFNDITHGNNPGCGTKGFTAVPGWDPVTGLGTPNYPDLLKLFLSLP